MFRILFSLVLIFSLINPCLAATKLEDEGVNKGYINVINCTGDGVTCSKAGIVGTVNVPAGLGTGDMLKTTYDPNGDGIIDISTNTNLTAGTGITLTGDTVSVTDNYILNTGDTMTGTYDFSGATVTGISVALNDIDDPTTATAISFADNEGITFSTAEDTGIFFSIANTDVDLAHPTYLMDLRFQDDGSAYGIYLQCLDDSEGTPNPVFTIGADGDVASDGTITANAFSGDGSALTSLDGTAVSNADLGDISVAGGVWTLDASYLTTVDISDNTNLTAGTGITLTGDTVSVTDNYVLNTGDTVTGAYDFGGASSIEIVNGSAPTVDAAGEIAVDTTDDQFVYYGGAKRVIPYERQACLPIENLAAADDNYGFFMANDAITITGVGCNCRGTCSTMATLTLEDRGGNAMTITGTNPTCATTGAATYAAVTAGNQLTAGEILAFDVTNTPSPETDEYVICITFTVDSQ